jgi:hypothetical protein
MDRCDPDQEGITLPRTDMIRLIARDEASKAILTHLKLCPLVDQQVATRLRCLELSFWKLVGFMIGSGLLGGCAGSLLTNFLR